MGKGGIKEVMLLLGAVFLILIGVFVGIWVSERGIQPDYIIVAPDVDVVPPAVAATIRPTFTPALAIPFSSPVLSVSQPAPELTPTPRQPVPIQGAPVADPGVVTFQVIVPEVLLYPGPGNAYAPHAMAQQGTILPVVARSADGLWWQVCCLEGSPVWLALDGKTALAGGDANLVPISEAVVYNITPTPPPIAVAPDAPPANREASAPAPTAPPLPPLEPGNPACATGEAYSTIATIGESDRRPAALNPEINLAVRNYVLVDEFRQMVGIGGETDVHAPQFHTLFGDKRIMHEFPAVYRAHEWDYNCNCRGAPIGFPEVTVVGLSTQQGEILHTPARSQGDIGSGYVAMILYATPNSITLKYTREDNMLMGYGIHLEGLCVDPNLLALYRQQDQAGRNQLPVLHAGQGLGLGTGGELKLAVRDTGQFMDPRSHKDWWVAD